MEAKDIFSVAISALALTVSCIALWRSSRSKHLEDRRLARTQISDILAELSDKDIENTKVYHEHGKTDMAFAQAVSAILNGRRVLMIQQARFWMGHIPDLVTSADYASLASACNYAWDLSTAEEMQRRAIDKSRHGFERAVVLRSYGVMLFGRGRNAEARKMFEQSILEMNQTDDASRFTNGLTYQIWGWDERNSGREDYGRGQFDNAEAEFRLIRSENMRIMAMEHLQTVRQRPDQPPAAPIILGSVDASVN